MRAPPSRSGWLPPVVILMATVGAMLVIVSLGERVRSDQRAQVAIVSLQSKTIRNLEIANQRDLPTVDEGAHNAKLAATVTREVRSDEAMLSAGLTSAARSGASAQLVAAGRADLTRVAPAEAAAYALGTGAGGLSKVSIDTAVAVQAKLIRSLAAVSSVFSSLGRADAAAAERAREEAAVGTVIAMAFLLLVLGYFYFRAVGLGRENERLLEEARREASTDAVTGLGNRRALTRDLSKALSQWSVSDPHELLVAIFDLNGFKTYNDAFGHVDGDVLLARLGERLADAVAATGTAYRMGGDEFCMVATCASDAAEALLEDAVNALSFRGEGWQIGCSHGAVWVPSEAATLGEALRTADGRMYANKATRSSAGRQVADALLQLAREREDEEGASAGRVADLSAEVARALARPHVEVERIRLAATLRHIGKAALHDAPLEEPHPARAFGGAQDRSDPAGAMASELPQRHTVIGERIVAAAPALADIAPLIRSSHERVDGGGYPDGLVGKQIPLGSRIIAVCDAFDAMTSARPDRQVMSIASALEELRRCAGSQFDAAVVEALSRVATRSEAAREPRVVSAA